MKSRRRGRRRKRKIRKRRRRRRGKRRRRTRRRRRRRRGCRQRRQAFFPSLLFSHPSRLIFLSSSISPLCPQYCPFVCPFMNEPRWMGRGKLADLFNVFFSGGKMGWLLSRKTSCRHSRLHHQRLTNIFYWFKTHWLEDWPSHQLV